MKILFSLKGHRLRLEPHEAKLARPAIFYHYFGVSHDGTFRGKMASQIFLFQVFWQIFDN